MANNVTFKVSFEQINKAAKERLKEMFSRFRKVMTVEINYSDTPGDPYINEETRRYGQLAWVLRAHTLVDVDCWTSCPGQPLRPRDIYRHIVDKLPTNQEGVAA